MILYRRTDQGFRREVYNNLEMSLPLPELGLELPLNEIYDGVTFEEPPTQG